MVLSTMGGLPSQDSTGVDLRYQNADFRIQQAPSYFNFPQGNARLSKEEHILILRHCYYEIRKIQAWNTLTSVERGIFKICNPFFSRLPNDAISTLRISGASVLSIVAIMISAHTKQDKIAGVAVLGFTALLCKEMFWKK